MTYLPSTHKKASGSLAEGLGRGWAGPAACCQAPQVVVYQRGCCRSFRLPSNRVLSHSVFLMKVFRNSLCDYLCRIPRRITSELLAYSSWLRAILHPSNFVQLCSQPLHISLPGKTTGWFGGISKHHFSSCGLTSKSYLMSIMWFEGRFRSSLGNIKYGFCVEFIAVYYTPFSMSILENTPSWGCHST